MEYYAVEFASYADDTTPYTYGQSFDEIIEKLEINCLEIRMSKICEWFLHNGFKAISFFTNPIHRQTNKNDDIYYKSK